MSRPPSLKEGEEESFPRVSGDEPREYEKDFTAGSFSPRERG